MISPDGQKFPSSYKLAFENTNNTAEYEALLLGIEEAKRRNIKLLKARGDVELIVKQVKDMFSVKNQRLKHYRNHVWDEIEGFDAFAIEAIPREQNDKADSLAVSASLLSPHPNFINRKYLVEIIHRPSVSNNKYSWQLFKDDANINSFL